MSLTDQANLIVRKLKSNELTRNDLSSFFTSTQINLQEVNQLNNVEEIKNVSTPFLVMLSNQTFTSNDYLRQTICAKAYYCSSYFIQTNILDEFNAPKPEGLIDFVELLKLRLMLLLNGKDHFPDLIFRVPNNPNISKYWTPLSNNATSDKQGFKDMVMADAGLISKYASFPLMGTFQQENLKFANSVLADNKNLLVNNTIDDLIIKGLTMHKLLFSYLERSLTNNGKLDFHSDDDDN